MENEHRAKPYLDKTGVPQVPALELADGTVLTEVPAICRYLEALHPEPPLFGRDPVEQAVIEMWNRRFELEIMNPIGQIARHSFEFFKDRVEQIPAYAESQRRLAAKRLAWLDGELADGRPFLAGESFSVADITGMAASMLADFVKFEISETLTHMRRWDDRLRSRPSWDA